MSSWAGSNRASRLPKDWSKRRALVMERDRSVCYVCRQLGADEVDHIVPGDDHSLKNLAAIHGTPCHKAKTDREKAEGVRRFYRARQRARAVTKHPGLR